MLEHLVVQAFLLNARALVHRFHGAQYSTAFGDAVEFTEHRFLDQVGQLLDDEGALQRVFVLGQAQLLIDDELDGHGPAHAGFGRRGDGLVVGVGVQRVAVVVDRVERLQRGADVVEVDFLGVQRAAGRLDVVLQHLRPGRGAVFLAHGLGPNPTGHTPNHRILRVDAVREEEAQVGPKLVDVHAPAQVVLHVGESVGQGERQLGDRIRAGLGDVVAADGDRVEVSDVVADEVVLHVAHQPKRKLRGEDARVLGLVFFQDVGLHGAPHAAQGLGLQRAVGGRVEDFVARASQEQQAQPVVAFRQIAVVGGAGQSAVVPFGLQHGLHLGFHAVLADVLFAALVDGGVQEKPKQHRRRAVDGHGHAGVGRAEVEPAVELLGVVQAADADPGVPDFPVNVWPDMGVASVQGHRVKRRRQALGWHAQGDVVETLVGALRPTFAGEHARGILALPLEGVNASGVGEGAGQVFLQVPLGQVAPSRQRGQGNLGDVLVGEALARGGDFDVLAPHLKDVLVGFVTAAQLRPAFEPFFEAGIQIQLDVLAPVGQGVGRVSFDQVGCGGQGLELSGQVGLLLGPPVVSPAGFGDFAEVARPGRGDDEHLLAGALVRREIGRQRRARLVRQRVHHAAVELVGPRVVELGRDGAHNREIVVVGFPQVVVALELLPHVAQRVLGAPLVKLVDGHHVGEVEHVDFLQLRRRPELWGHHVQRHVAVVHDLGVALANAAGLQHDQVEFCGLEDVKRFLHMTRQGQIGLPGGQGTHVHPVRVNGVHADAVAEQRPAGLSLGRIDAYQRDALLGEVDQEAPHELVHHGRFSRPAGAGDAEHGDDGKVGLDVRKGGAEGFGVVLRGRDAPGQVAHVALGQPRGGAVQVVQVGDRVEVRALDQVVDHALQPHGPSVVGVVDAFDAVVVQLLNFFRQDGASAAAKNSDVPCAPLVQQVLHVFEVLHVPALVGGHGDGLGVFLNGRGDHLVHAAVVPQVDDLTSGFLHDPPHDVDGGVVAVKQARGGDDADFVLGLVGGLLFHVVAWLHAKLAQTRCRP